MPDELFFDRSLGPADFGARTTPLKEVVLPDITCETRFLRWTLSRSELPLQRGMECGRSTPTFTDLDPKDIRRFEQQVARLISDLSAVARLSPSEISKFKFRLQHEATTKRTLNLGEVLTYLKQYNRIPPTQLGSTELFFTVGIRQNLVPLMNAGAFPNELDEKSAR